MENKIKELAAPLVQLIRENYDPYTKIIITDTNIEVVTTELGIPCEGTHV